MLIGKVSDVHTLLCTQRRQCRRAPSICSPFVELFSFGVKSLSSELADSFIYLPCLDILESVNVDALNDWLNGSNAYDRKRKLMRVSNDIRFPMMVGPVMLSKKQWWNQLFNVGQLLDESDYEKTQRTG